MSDAPVEEKLHAPTIDSMAAFSKQLKEVTDSLNLLYIPNNASGRNKFRHKWPDVALFIFGDELIQLDNKGVTDRERRSELEEQADEKRIQLKQTISEIIDKSVDQGSLLFDYVGSIIDLYGVGISRFLYAEDVIERVRPGVLASCVTVQEADDAKKEADDAARDEIISKNAAVLNDSSADQGYKMPPEYKTPLEDQKLSVEEQSILSNTSDGSKKRASGNTLDDVKPIDTEAPLSSVRTLNNPVPEEEQGVEEKSTEAEQSAEEQPKEGVSDVETVEAVELSSVPVPDAVAPEIKAPPLQDKPEENLERKQEEEKAAAPLSPPSMSEALDSVKPIDTGSVPVEAPQKESPPEPSEEAAEVVVKEDAPKEVPVEEKKPIEAVVPDPAKEEPAVEAPVIEEPPADVPKTETPKMEVVEKPAPEVEPAGKVEKGTYVALFNGLAQVV